MISPPESGPPAGPFLDYKTSDVTGPHRVLIDVLPFRIGRGPQANLVIHSRDISKLHAEIVTRDDDYVIRDLGSRNGTFVDGERVVGERILEAGACVVIATQELQFGVGAEVAVADSTLLSDPDVQSVLIRGVRDLGIIMADRAIAAVFQAVVSMSSDRCVGYEALSRPAAPELDYSLAELFELSTVQGVTAELSRLMRDIALESAHRVPASGQTIFFNVHPAELASDTLLPSLAAIGDALRPGTRAVIEFPEAAITDLDQVRRFRAELAQLGLGMAYDDFGAGQSRLMELAEVPPDIIKLDMSLIQGIDQSAPRQELVAALVRVMRQQGVEVLAEGIETEAEWQTCRDLGCDLAQGYFRHRPARIDDLTDAD